MNYPVHTIPKDKWNCLANYELPIIKEKETKMNNTTVVFLINDKVRAIHATYEADEHAVKTLFKTLDKDISVGDYIIVPTATRHKMTVCKVVAVDIEVDYDSSTLVDWVIGKVDRSAHEQTVAQEAVAIQTIRAAEVNKKRDDLRKALIANNEATIKALPISSFTQME